MAHAEDTKSKSGQHLKKIRNYIFLRDVAWLAIAAFGGPQVHIAMFLRTFVEKRGYLSEKEFLELNALCQVLPGPTSTQTIVALGFRIGGPTLAYLTLLVWCLPGVSLMTFFGLTISYFNSQKLSLDFLQFIQPMAVGFVGFAAYRITSMVVNTKTGVALMLISTLAAFLFRSPWVFPLVVVGGGLVTSLKFRQQPKEQKTKLTIKWGNFWLFWGVLIFSAILGAITKFLPVLLFENFYRNGSFIFGGGQVLIPVLLTEFVNFKGYLNENEFLSGYALAQLVPGPVFSFCAFIGVLSLRDYGIGGEIAGGLIAAAGIFLPGTFIIFFVIRFWSQLKKYRVIKASLEGIHAASSGLVIAAAILLLIPLSGSWLNILIMLVTFLVLQFTKVPPPVLIFCGLIAGGVYEFVL